MAKISAALKKYREQLASLDEMGRTNMNADESATYQGFSPGMTKQEVDDATEQALATKNAEEATQMLGARDAATKDAKAFQKDKALRDALEERRKREQRIKDAIVYSSVLAHRDDSLAEVPMGYDQIKDGQIPVGLDMSKLALADIPYLPGGKKKNE